MANENQMAVAQTNTVEPSQANKVVNNIDKISDTQTPVSVLQADKPMFNQDLKDSFFNSEAWKQYTGNELRKLQPNIFPGFSAIEKAAENPIWAATIDRYGDAVATRQQAIHSTYAKANGALGRFGQAYNAQRYGLRASAARKDLSDALMSGDEVKISEARNKYQNELRNQYERGYAYDDETANTLMSLLASSARNWETIPIEILGALAIPFTGGGSEVAARAINTAIVGADTYRLETGGALEQIDRLGIDMTEEQKREKSIPVGALNAAIEAGLFGIGGNIAGAGTRYIGTKVAKRTFKKGLEKRLGREISEEAANRLYQIKFLSELQKSTAKEGLGQVIKEFTLDGAGEGLQEVVQDTNTGAMISAIQNNTSWGDELGKEWASFAANPFAPEHAEKWKTFFNVMITSPVLGGAYRGVGAVTDLAFKGNRQKKANEMKTEFSGAYNNTLGLSRLFDWHKDGDAKNAIGAANAALQEAINTDPNVTGKLYTTIEQVQEMQKDPEVAAALAQMGVEAGLQQAAENGGVVELDLIAYDKIVNEKQNTVLFQKMRNYLSFSETTMSMNEFNQFIKTNSETITQQISEEVKNNADSIYNKVRNMFLEAGEQQSVANAYAAMAHIMLTGAQGFTQGEKNDILDRITIRVPDGKGGTITRRLGEFKTQTPTTTTPTVTTTTQTTPTATPTVKSLPAVNGNNLSAFDAKGNLRDDVWQQIRALFPEEKLQQVYTSEPGGSQTFEELLRRTVDKPQQVAQEHSQYALNLVAKHFDITPEQITNAIRLARGEPITQDEADVNVGGMVDKVFAEENQGQPRVYHMVVYAGSRVDYDKPSLEAIGTGEGAAAHGWGLYYALNPDIADRYREMFTGDPALKYDEEKLNDLYTKLERSGDYDKASVVESVLLRHDERDINDMLEEGMVSKEAVDWFNGIKDKYLNKKKKTGQVVKADIPEIDLLLDEQKDFNEQSDFVKQALSKVFSDLSEESVNKLKENELYSIKSKEDLQDLSGADGEEIYNILSYALGSAKSASQMLEKYGIKGITYDGERDGRCFVIFNPDDVKVLGKKFDELGKTLFMFVGSRTEGTVNNMADKLGKRKELDEARAMEKAAEDKGEMPDYEAIWQKTGWYKEPDTSWSYEVSDEKIDFKDKTNVLTSDGKVLTKGSFKLGDFINHPELFKVMPELKDVNVSLYNDPKHDSTRGGYTRSTDTIRINAAAFNNYVSKENRTQEILDTLSHEIQHAVQWKLNMLIFARGEKDEYIHSGKKGATENAKLIKMLSLGHDVLDIASKYNVPFSGAMRRGDVAGVFAARNKIMEAAQTKEEKKLIEDFVDKYLETKDYNIGAKGKDVGYYRYSHEIQARNTATRRTMTAEQRRAVSPSATLDIAGKTQVGRAISKKDLLANTRILRVVKFASAPFRQTQVEAGRTTANQGQYNIALTPDTNVVTFAHELFHVFSLELQRVYNSGNITDYWRKQAEKLYKIAGVNTATDSDVVLTEAQEEHLANMFTTFLMRGKLENKEVRGLLSKLILMFKDAYKQLEGQGLTALAVDSYAREFFDSLFMLEEDMTEIQRAAGLIAIEKPENVDRELYDFYVASIAESAITASNELNRKLYAIKAFKQNKKGDGKYKQLMDKYKDEARKELMDTDEYKVKMFGDMFTGEDKVERTFEKVQLEMPEANLSMGDVANMLKNTRPLEQEVNRLANAKMDAYIAKEFKLTPKELSLKEDRNRAKVRALIAEDVMRKGGKLSDLEAELKKAEDAADKHMGNISVYQIIDEEKWKGRESASVDRYLWAKKQGREDLMAAERFNQAVINLIMIKGKGFKSEYDKMTDLFKKLQSRQRKYEYKDENGNVLGNEFRYNAVDWELLRSISANFGNPVRDPRRSIKTTHQQLREWIDLQVAERFTTVKDLEAYMPFIDRGSDKSLGAMKGKDFKRLYTVMNIIDSVASREQYLFVEGQYARMREFVEQTIKFHNEMNIKTDENANDWYRKFFGRYGTWQNPEPLLRAIFPPEVFQKIFLPLFNGGVTAEYTAKLWQNKWNEAKAKINTTTKPFILDDGTQITYRDGSFTKVMSYADVADLLLAMGANHAYENYKLKFGLTDEQAQMIASQALARNKNYAEFMNTTWSVYGEATKLLNESFQERTNELFVKKDHRAFEINGIKFEGGYVPEDKHYEALVREMGSQNTGVHNKKESKNEKLITKSADGQVMSIIDITELKLSQSAKWAFASVPFNNVKKFIENEDVKAAMGSKAYKFIVDWLQNYDMPHFDISGVWRPLNNLTTVAALGLKASTAVLQLSGIVQSVSTIGTKYTARGALQFIRENGFFRPFELAKKKSVGLAQRLENPFSAYTGIEGGGRSFKDILNSYNAKTGVGKFGAATLAAFQRVALWPIQLIDGYVAIITWNGAYTRAIEQGMSETEAKAEADSVVRVTQSDASQISRSAALQEPSARAITAFGTWFMAMRSQAQALTTSKKYRADLIQWVVGYAVVGTFIEALLDETLSGDDDDEDKKTVDKIINTWYNKIAETIGGQVMPFAGLGSSITKSIAASVLNDDDDKVIKSYAGGSVAALQYAWRLGDTFARGIKYARTGEEEDRNKFLISASSALSNSIKKQVKRMLED